MGFFGSSSSAFSIDLALVEIASDAAARKLPKNEYTSFFHQPQLFRNFIVCEQCLLLQLYYYCHKRLIKHIFFYSSDIRLKYLLFHHNESPLFLYIFRFFPYLYLPRPVLIENIKHKMIKN